MLEASREAIGFVGLGQMGLRMARNLIVSGRRVRAWSRDASERDAFAAAGGEVASSLGDLAGLPVVMSIVFDDQAVREIALRPGALCDLLSPGSLHVSMETISPALARELSEAYADRGIEHLTSPVFGPPHWAEARQLKFNCSGARSAYEAAEPILSELGEPFWFGPEPEQGLMVKLMGNNMIFTIIELMHEAFTFLGEGGLKSDDVKAMLVQRLFQSPIITGYADFFVQNPGARPRFNANPIPAKDNSLCLEAAKKLGVTLPLVDVVHRKIIGSSDEPLGL